MNYKIVILLFLFVGYFSNYAYSQDEYNDAYDSIANYLGFSGYELLSSLVTNNLDSSEAWWKTCLILTDSTDDYGDYKEWHDGVYWTAIQKVPGYTIFNMPQTGMVALVNNAKHPYKKGEHIECLGGYQFAGRRSFLGLDGFNHKIVTIKRLILNEKKLKKINQYLGN